MMMWRTILQSQNSPLFKKILLWLLLLFSLFGTGMYSCGGSGNGGATSPLGGGGGGAGAPPVSIPGPEALNMTGIMISPPDERGVVTVSGGPGAATPGNQVRLRNLGPNVAGLAWRLRFKEFFIRTAYAAGPDVFVAVNGNGSFSGQLQGALGEWIAFAQFRQVAGPENMGQVKSVVNNGPFPPVPASQTKPFMKQKMVFDQDSGNGWVIQGASAKKWNWLSLFVSTAYADEVLPPVNNVTCPALGGNCVLNLASGILSEGACILTPVDSLGKEQENKALKIPFCKEVNDFQFYKDKTTNQKFLLVATGKNFILLKENTPDKWQVSQVLSFGNPILKIQSDMQMNVWNIYLLASHGFYAWSPTAGSVLSIPIKPLSTNAGIPTALAKSGNHMVYAMWMNRQAFVAQEDLVRDAGFANQKVISSNIAAPVSDIIFLDADGSRSIKINSENLNYHINRYALIAAKKLYLYEVPTPFWYDEIAKNNPEFDFGKLEKLIVIDIPEASKDLSMIANNPEATLLAVSDEDKIFYIDYTYGETVQQFDARKLSRVTDLRGESGVSTATLVYNPISHAFILRTRSSSSEISSPSSAPSLPRSSRPAPTSVSIQEPSASMGTSSTRPTLTPRNIDISVH